MRRLVISIVLTVLALLALSSVAAAAGYQGKLQLFCVPQAPQQVDPLADFGVNPSPHLHSPAGASGTFSANETLAILEGATNTTCQLGSDLSQIWAPTPMQANGSPATLKNIAYYLINGNGATISASADFNPGLRFLVGNPTCSTVQCASASFYCYGTHASTGSTIPTSAQCPSGGYQETMHVTLPGQCWDGASLGQGFGASTPAASITMANPVGSPCSTRETIPDIVMTTDVDQNGVGGYLSSDYVPSEGRDLRTTCPGCTAHFDYAFNFQPAALQAIIGQCMYQPGINQNFLTCREGPLAPGGTGSASVYLNDPTTNRAEDGLNGEPYALVTP